jgi:hypothetical protein
MDIVNCCICNQTILQEEGQIRYRCGHISHNHCTMQRMVNDGFRIRCTTCHNLLLTDPELTAMLGNRYDMLNMTREPEVNVDNLIKTNPEVKATVKEYKKADRIAKKSVHAFRTELSDVVSEYKAEVGAYIAMIRESKKRYMNRIKSLPTYRTATHDVRAVQRLQDTMNDRWQIKTEHIMYDILHVSRRRRRILVNLRNFQYMIRDRLFALRGYYMI